MGLRVAEYNAYAAECERRAARTADPEVRAVYRAMIRCWLELASRAEWLDARERLAAPPVTIAADEVTTLSA